MLKPFSFSYSISIQADNQNEAKNTALVIGKKKAFEKQHPKSLDQGILGSVEIMNISGPLNEAKYPFASQAKWSKMSENYLS